MHAQFRRDAAGISVRGAVTFTVTGRAAAHGHSSADGTVRLRRMEDAKVAVFFYGSYMNRAVLAEVGLAPDLWEPTSLAGFDIVIAPRANLILSPGQCSLRRAGHRHSRRAPPAIRTCARRAR
jgi:hypothetical protein